MASASFRLLSLLDCDRSFSIFEQLQLEEALLRADDCNWCILNRGGAPAFSPAIVMGISGKPEKLLDFEKMTHHPIPLIRRYSGGGTVVVDEETFFVTLIGNKSILPCRPFPRPIMEWTAELYRPLFCFRENDYVIGRRKCGGNAQYLMKTRWMHHTSFLWGFREETMRYLKIPQKAPSYRQERGHADFLCQLKEVFADPRTFFEGVIACLEERFVVERVSWEEVVPVLTVPHRKATCLVEYEMEHKKKMPIGA